MKIGDIKKNIRIGLETVFGLLGVEAHLATKSDKNDRILFDKNMLSSFYNKNMRIKLYYEGLKRANVEWTDNFSKQCRFYSLQQIVEYVMGKELDGEFAECGCWKGHSAFIISKILSENNYKNLFHIFDSFSGGLSDKMSEDKNARYQLSEEQIESEAKIFASTEDEVRNTLSEFAFVKLYKGWIPERFNEVQSRKFSFVHIDVDLYQPTLKSLEFFYPRLLTGGCIVIDDYGLTQFPGCKKAVDIFLSKNRHEMFYEIPVGGCFIIK